MTKQEPVKCFYCANPADPKLGNLKRCKTCHADFLRDDLIALPAEIAQRSKALADLRKTYRDKAAEYESLMAESVASNVEQ